ncbi:MAG TPA: Hpt domain-containing protein, partial [Candidatus Acidoferrum sp.]|nr:Hpt domain-containing protein [Candidatus Acidoferrum sp.]
AFAPLADLSHAISGTSGLVGAESLHESAGALEELARAGEEAVARMEEAAARARGIATACMEGVVVMRQMLFVELDHRGDTALDLAQNWMSSIAHLRPAAAHVPAAPSAHAGEKAAAPGFQVPPPVAIPVAVAGPPPEVAADAADEPPVFTAGERFRFDSVAGESQPGDVDSGWSSPVSVFRFEKGADGFGGELLGIFRQEGQETVRALDAALAQLRARPGDMAAVASLERLYHTMKGAASIVGLDEVARAAAAIQERLEAELERGASPTGEAVALLVSETEALLLSAGLPGLAAPDSAPSGEAAPVTSAQAARRFFIEEVGELQREGVGLIDELMSSSADVSLHARLELGKLFHRLKGSALLVAETRVAGEAEKMQALFEPDGTASAAPEDLAPAARGALTRIATLLGTEPPGGLADGPAAPAGFAPQREPVAVTAQTELWDAFMQESRELGEAIERECLALEDSAQPREVLDKLMSLLHTLKGVLNTVGLAPTAGEIHRVEDFVESLMKSPILPPMREVANLLLQVRADVQKNLGQAASGYVETSLPRLEARIARVLLAARDKADPPGGASRGDGAPARGNGANVTSIAEARSARQSAASAAVPSSRGVAAELGERKFIRVGIARLDALMNLAGELVVSRSRLLDRVGTLRRLQRELGRGSNRLADAVDEFRDAYEYVNIDGRGNPPLRRQPVPEPAAEGWDSFGELELDRYEDIHVFSRRLTEVASDVTELSSQLSRSLTTFNDDAEVFDTIVSGIRTEVTRARMVPLDVLFSRLRLPVRDAAERDQKDVRVVIEGADVSIDKTIADGLFGPMLHLVRNAVVHGIEPSAVRQDAGKPAVGTITLAARQESGQVVVEVADDGAGLDLDALRAAGARLGVVADDVPLDDAAVKDLVFVSGLSTRAQAGAVSGRGVGCDVVRRAVLRMNGTIQVDTRRGIGTRFLLKLPVTLAITKAMLVRAGQRTYAVPLHFAERIVDVVDEPIVVSAGSRRIKVEDSFIHITHLETHLGGSRYSATGPVLLLTVGEQRAAIQVDAVIGQEEIVVKSLGDILTGHPLLAGVTMRGSGELVLIVDVPGLMDARAARRRGGIARPTHR